MKLIAFFVILSIAPVVFADFHILGLIQPWTSLDPNLEDIVHDDVIACPSNHYNCKCYGYNDRARLVTTIDDSTDLPDNGYFQLGKGLCGMPAMDFYRRGDGRWEF